MSKNILYTATWCVPCTKLKERLEAAGLLDNVEVVVIDDTIQQIKQDEGLRTIPALKTKNGLVSDSNKILTLSKENNIGNE